MALARATRAKWLAVALLACATHMVAFVHGTIRVAKFQTTPPRATGDVGDLPGVAGGVAGGVVTGGNIVGRAQQLWDFIYNKLLTIERLPAGSEKEEQNEHVAKLVRLYAEAVRNGMNVHLPSEQAMPSTDNLVRGTPFTDFVLSVLRSRYKGLSAIYGSPNLGKSVSCMEAAAGFGQEQTNDLIWIVKNDVEVELRTMLRLTDSAPLKKILPLFFSALSEEIGCLHIIIDNCFDNGMFEAREENLMRLITRESFMYGHQVVCVLQSLPAATVAANLNGNRAFIHPEQAADVSMYRWTADLTRKYLQTAPGNSLVAKWRQSWQRFNPADLDVSDQDLDTILQESQVPDGAGKWLVGGVQSYLDRGLTPSPPVDEISETSYHPSFNNLDKAGLLFHLLEFVLPYDADSAKFILQQLSYQAAREDVESFLEYRNNVGKEVQVTPVGSKFEVQFGKTTVLIGGSGMSGKAFGSLTPERLEKLFGTSSPLVVALINIRNEAVPALLQDD